MRMVIGEVTSLEEMVGGARMHATAGHGDNLVVDDEDALDAARFGSPTSPRAGGRAASLPAPAAGPAADRGDGPRRGAPRLRRPRPDRRPGRRRVVLRAHAAVRPRGGDRARAHGRRPVGVVANNPAQKGGVLFVDSADKAAQFVAVRCVQHPAGVPGRRARVHGRHRGRAGRHHPPRGQDGHGGERGHGPQGAR